MKKNKKFLTKLVAGIFFGTILGFVSFTKMMAYGLKHECVTNTISNTVCCGYDQCGFLGFIIGIITGSLFGVIAVIISITKFKTLNYSKIIKKLILSALIIFFVYGILFSSSWLSFKNYLSFALPIILIHILLSSIMSLTLIGIIGISKKFLQKSQMLNTKPKKIKFY